MTKRRTLIAAGAAFAIAAGSAGAIAATSSDEGKKREDAVLADAAKRLGVTPEKLRDALGDAQDAQLDAAVRRGELTREQADAIKARRQSSGRVLGFGHRLRGPHGMRGMHGMHGAFGDVLDAVTKALGISREELFRELRDGKSVADIAKAQGKDLDDVKGAAKKAIAAELDEAVKDGRLTDARRDRITSRLDEHLDRLAQRGLPHRGFRHHP